MCCSPVLPAQLTWGLEGAAEGGGSQRSQEKGFVSCKRVWGGRGESWGGAACAPARRFAKQVPQRGDGGEQGEGLSAGKSPGKDRSLLERTRDAGTWPAKGLGVPLGASAASHARNMKREGMEGERGALWGRGVRPGTEKGVENTEEVVRFLPCLECLPGTQGHYW